MSVQQKTAIIKIIKRLELIKSLIALEEDDEININVDKLKAQDLTAEVENILTLLEQKYYSKAIICIEEFINSRQRITLFVDAETDALKLEIKILEAEVNLLSNEKAEAEKLVHQFGVRHNSELGELIIKILRYRKEKAKDTPQQQEAAEDYNTYYKTYEETKDETVIALTEDEQKELKDKYRKASKLCHPDVVRDEQKEEATKLFAELNAANERNDLKRVSEILENLEKGNFFINKSDALNEKKLLKAEMEKLRLRIIELKEQLMAIKESDTYKTVTTITDWDEYFADTKEKLQQQLNALEN